MRLDVLLGHILPTRLSIAGTSSTALGVRTATVNDVCLVEGDAASTNVAKCRRDVRDDFVSEGLVHVPGW